MEKTALVFMWSHSIYLGVGDAEHPVNKAIQLVLAQEVHTVHTKLLVTTAGPVY